MNQVSPDKYRVAIVGGGPAGLGIASGLARRGIGPVALVERRDILGGVPARYKRGKSGVPTFIDWTSGRALGGGDFADRLVRKILGTDTEVFLQTQVLRAYADQHRLTMVNPQRGRFDLSADVIVFACGAREMNIAERSWIAGSRSARIYFTNHLIEWLDRHQRLPMQHPVVIGSDLIAFSAAAKLRAASSDEISMLDHTARPQSSLGARLYFRRWTDPKWHGRVQDVTFEGVAAIEGVTPSSAAMLDCDGAVVSGELVPNTELALLGGFDVELPSRRLVLNRQQQLSSSSWFASGNVTGDCHGAQWCYFNGHWIAHRVAQYLANA